MFKKLIILICLLLLPCVADGFEIDDMIDHITNTNRSISQQEAYHISYMILKYSKEYQLSPELILSIIHVESTFKKEAVSKKWHARGLMQVRWVVWGPLLKENGIDNYKSLHKVENGIKAGIIVLEYYLYKYKDLKTALWAYNGKAKDKLKYYNKVMKVKEKLYAIY